MDMDKEISFGDLFKKKDKKPKEPKQKKEKVNRNDIHKKYRNKYASNNFYSSSSYSNRSLAPIIGGVATICALLIVVFSIRWIINNVDGFFKEGVVQTLTYEPTEVRQFCHEREVTRTATRVVPNTRIVDGKTTTTMVTESYQVFDYYEYDLYEETDHEDYIVVIRAESKKEKGYRDKMFYIVNREGISEKDYYESLIPGSFHIVKEMHVKSSDSNNDLEKLDTSRNPFPGIKMGSPGFLAGLF